MGPCVLVKGFRVKGFRVGCRRDVDEAGWVLAAFVHQVEHRDVGGTTIVQVRGTIVPSYMK